MAFDFENIFKYINDEIILTDNKFNIIFHNAKLIDKGHKKTLFDVTESMINNNVKKQILSFGKSDNNHIFFKLIIKNDELSGNIPVNLHICKIKDSKVKGYCIIIQDVIQEVRNKIQKATFVDIISHDLKNPMRANIQILELILNNKFGKIDNNLRPVLNELLDSCRFMNYMADNLLIKYKNETELSELKKQKYSVVKLIKDQCETLSNQISRKNQSVELVIKSNTDDIYIDVEKIKKVINNLIINASEQSIENSKIVINIENTTELIIISFVSQGYKLNNNALNDMFEEYISCSNKFRKVGFSLELFNCKKIIEAHNGDITAKNGINGMEITVSLPVKQVLSGMEKSSFHWGEL